MRVFGEEALRRLGGQLALAQASAQGAAQGAGASSFWERHGDAILVAVVTAVLVLLAQEPLKYLFRKLFAGIDRALQGTGWRLRKRYLAALPENHRWLKLIGIYSRAQLHPPRLKEVYISLRLAAAGAAASTGAEGAARLSWHEILTGEERCTAILGAPGAGKSTLLDYLVLVLTGWVSHPLRRQLGRSIPLFARLRELGADEARGDLLGLLRSAAPLKRVPASFPQRWLARGRCVVLLDGLDEVLDAGQHRRAVEEIQRLVADYPGNRYVVTCRVAGWHNQLPAFRTYEIQELGEDDVRRFAGAWYREVLRTLKVNLLGREPEAAALERAEAEALREARGKAEKLWGELRSNRHLLLMARTPLILSLITLVHHFQLAKLPKQRAGLYHRCLEVLLEIWDAKEKGLAAAGGLPLKDKVAVLETLAYRFLVEGRLEADEGELEKMLEPLLLRLSAPVAAAALIHQIWQRSGILVEHALGRYGFAHRALHDHLAASYMVGHELDGELLPRAGEERWREVILIAVGLAPAARAEKLVRAFLAAGEESPGALEMAGRALAEEVHLGEDLEAEVKNRLLARLGAEEQPGAFGRLAGALMAADLEAARTWMAQALRGRDPGLRERVLGLLPELGEEHGRHLAPLLIRLLGDGAEEPALRARAARALGEMGAEAGAETWEGLAGARRDADESLRAAATWAWCELGRYEDLGLVKVPAGEFLMGSEQGEGDSDEQPQHSLYLPTFYLAKHPVTVDDFRSFVEESGQSPKDPDALRGQPDHPALWVSWHEALAYARWHGMGLPSEAEWEKGARGTDGRRFPWGEEWRPGLANTAELSRSGRRRLGRWLSRRKVSGTTPVGRFSPDGDSPYGCADMTGNVWEWTRSVDGPYPYDPTDGREVLEVSSQPLRVLRGGSFILDQWFARCAFRSRYNPDNRSDLIGFRVVVSPFTSGL